MTKSSSSLGVALLAALLAAALTGVAVFARSGRLDALGFGTDEIVARLDARFNQAV